MRSSKANRRGHSAPARPGDRRDCERAPRAGAAIERFRPPRGINADADAGTDSHEQRIGAYGRRPAVAGCRDHANGDESDQGALYRAVPDWSRPLYSTNLAGRERAAVVEQLAWFSRIRQASDAVLDHELGGFDALDDTLRLVSGGVTHDNGLSQPYLSGLELLGRDGGAGHGDKHESDARPVEHPHEFLPFIAEGAGRPQRGSIANRRAHYRTPAVA